MGNKYNVSCTVHHAHAETDVWARNPKEAIEYAKKIYGEKAILFHVKNVPIKPKDHREEYNWKRDRGLL